MIVYNKLWQTMKDKGITQYALINQYHVSAGQLSRLEHQQPYNQHALRDLRLSAWRYNGIYKGRGLSLFFFFAPICQNNYIENGFA